VSALLAWLFYCVACAAVAESACGETLKADIGLIIFPIGVGILDQNFVESPGGEGFSTPIPIPPNGTSYSAAISLPGLRPEDFQNWLKIVPHGVV